MMGKRGGKTAKLKQSQGDERRIRDSKQTTGDVCSNEVENEE